ncbi:MAG: tetratricopeptide repeat protein [Verrucomicrobia bacterium]|nr:tetratricopeptide repeat protein [Verrucomicrobiota bacterium]
MNLGARIFDRTQLFVQSSSRRIEDPGSGFGAACTLKVRSVLVFGCLAGLLAVALTVTPANAQTGANDKANESRSKPRTVESIVEATRLSVVTVSHSGRDAKEAGVGSGFVVSPDGLIATCLHVIGEARPIVVRFPDGKRYDVAEIHAWDRKLDLALVRIDANKLPPLPLGDSDELKQGAPVVAMGNPLGLENSVVQGVVSAKRDFEGVQMIQLAIPIEEGNSGGPLLDMQGNVHGILSMKSALSGNLGFAIPVNALKLLLSRPNPVPMTRWLTIGALNPKEWLPLMGARWTQKTGQIRVDGLGQGFGGRALCLHQKPVPRPPYEVAVSVRLDDEAGAAGLAFESDGDQRHYGFYPSAGNLRLTRFDGPDVFTWTILKEVASPHYRPGEWNRLRVQVEEEALRCYVNEKLVVELNDRNLRGGKVGLAKFRATQASFKNFQLGTNLGPSEPPWPADFISAVAAQINSSIHKLDAELISKLRSHPQAGRSVLTERVRALEQQAAELRELAATLHREAVRDELVKLFKAPDERVDLFRTAMLLAKLDLPELDIESYQRALDDMASELSSKLPAQSDDLAKLQALKEFLFVENGFHGSRTDYYNRANSYLNSVLDDREGIPITLSVLFIELARRIGLENVAGVSLPGHFIVKYTPKEGAEHMLDVFDGGKRLTVEEARAIVTATGRPFRDAYLQSAPKSEIIVRMLRNLAGIARGDESPSGALRYLDLILALAPDATEERLERAMIRSRRGDRSGAKEDLKWLLDNEPPEINLDRVRELYRLF